MYLRPYIVQTVNLIFARWQGMSYFIIFNLPT